MKGTAGRTGRCARWLTSKPHWLTQLPTNPRGSCQQGFGVRVAVVAEELFPGAELDDLTEVHHRDPVAEEAHGCEVMRDQQHADAELERRSSNSSRIVAWTETSSAEVGSSSDQNARLDGERARDREPLALTAGEGGRAGGRAPPRAARPAPSARGSARLLRAPRASSWTASSSRNTLRIVSRGFSDEYGSWNTSCTARCWARTARLRACHRGESHRSRSAPKPGDHARKRRLSAAGLTDKAERLPAATESETSSTATSVLPATEKLPR